MLLQTLQVQFDMLLAFDASPRDLNNGIINSAFAMLYKDFVKLYITYQSAIIRLLELYYSVNQVRKLQELLDAYKKYLVRMEKVSDFMRVTDAVGMDKNDLPHDITKLPHFNLKPLEARLKSFEQIYASSRIVTYDRMQSVELPKPNCDFEIYGRRRSLRKNSSSVSPVASSRKRNVDNLTELKEEPKVTEDKKRNDYTYVDLDQLEAVYTSSSGLGNKESDSDILDLLIDTNDDQQPDSRLKEEASTAKTMRQQPVPTKQMPNDWVQID